MIQHEVLTFLGRRRSVSAVKLTAPGPDKEALARLLAIAARVPDHGKLGPWRFLVIEGAAKENLVFRLKEVARTQPDSARKEAALQKLERPPTCVAVISQVKEAPIPQWEQILSTGAVCMNLLTAALAMGYGANWITDWYAYHEEARQLLRLKPAEHIAGFIYIGTASETQAERPRPDPITLTSWLQF